MRAAILLLLLLLSCLASIEGKKKSNSRYYTHHGDENTNNGFGNVGAATGNTENPNNNSNKKNRTTPLLIPLRRVSVNSGKNYEMDSLYVFNMNIVQDQPQQVNTVVDTQSNDNWVIDSSCKNCGGNASKGFACSSIECQDSSQQNNETFKMLDGKVRAVKYVPTSVEAGIPSIGQQNFTLDRVNDVIKLKNGTLLKERQAYIDQAQAGLGFGLDSNTGAFQSIAQANQIQKNQFTLVFQKEAGLMIIGNNKKYLSTTKNSSVFNVSQSQYQKPDNSNSNSYIWGQQSNSGNPNSNNPNDSPDIQDSWRVKVGPFLKIGRSPQMSSQNKDQPDMDPSSLYEGRFDSTTKYVLIPMGVWDRLDRTMFQFNSCTTDSQGFTLCSCKGSWQPINFQFVNDPSGSSPQNNTQKFEYSPTSYLEPVKGGVSKCLLLLKSQESEANIDYIFGTSFLQNYYSVYNFDDKTITLGPVSDFTLSSNLDNGLSLLWILIALLLAIALLAILCLLCKKKDCDPCQQQQHEAMNHHSFEQPIFTPCEPPQQQQCKTTPISGHQSQNTVSYLIRSPRSQNNHYQYQNGSSNNSNSYQPLDFNGAQQHYSQFQNNPSFHPQSNFSSSHQQAVQQQQQQQTQHFSEPHSSSQNQVSQQYNCDNNQQSQQPQHFLDASLPYSLSQPQQQQQQQQLGSSQLPGQMQHQQQQLCQQYSQQGSNYKPQGVSSPHASRVINSPNRNYSLYQQKVLYK